MDEKADPEEIIRMLEHHIMFLKKKTRNQQNKTQPPNFAPPPLRLDVSARERTLRFASG